MIHFDAVPLVYVSEYVIQGTEGGGDGSADVNTLVILHL